MLRTITLIAVLMNLAVPSSLQGGEDVLLKAMRDELDRSMTKLQLSDLDKPYFIAYTIQDGTNWRAAASLGSLLDKTETRARFLTVEVRVGDRTLDNTNFFSSPFGATGVVRMFGGTVRLPLEDDYQELRRQMWLATDGTYKKALEDISRKRAALRNRTEAERLADFSQEEAVQIREDFSPVAINLEEEVGLAKELSALFRQMPGIFTSKVRLGVSNVRTLYVNSEGSSFTRTSPTVSLVVLAATQAPDGMPLQDFVAIYGHAMGELPREEILAARVREMASVCRNFARHPCWAIQRPGPF
jgi:predicted Zn-dependent protease